ncbi:MAG: glycosyltransferase family 4 protein [Anaerolineales bacterium]
MHTRFLSLATTFVATTQQLHDQTTRQGIPAGRLVTIPNGTDTRQFHPVGSAARKRIRQALGLPQNALLATFVGAIRRVKGIDVLAKAWPRLATAVPDLHVCLAGPYRPEEHWGVSSTYVNELRRQFAQSPKHEKRVHFTGQVSNVIDYLHATDIFVFPSRSEGMPNALLEAMSCGLPFVATHLGSISEMAPSEQHPYLVPVDDPETLADALLVLAGDPALRRRLGAANRQVVQTRYSLDAVAGHYIALYRTLIK